MIIKVLLVAAALGIAVFVLREKAPGQRQALRRAGGAFVVLAGIIAVLWPELTTWAANLVGVARGTDLVLYGLVVVFAYTSLATAQRIHLLELDITALTRELALTRPARPRNEHTGPTMARSSAEAELPSGLGRTPEGP